MPKLNDTQLVILSAAARRKNGAVLPLPRSLRINKAAATTVLESLLKKGLVAERPAAADAAHWRGHALQSERANEGCRLPVSMRHRCPATHPPWRPAATPRHLGRGAGLVNEHKPLGLQIGLGVEPGPLAGRPCQEPSRVRAGALR